MARTTGTVKHTHKYFRQENGLWHCSGIDGCTHYLPKNMPAPVGRNSICWSCEKSFQLLPMNMERDKPMCDECMEKMDRVNQFMAKMMPDDDMDPVERRMKQIRERVVKPTPPTEPTRAPSIEVKEVEHLSDCASFLGLECDCMIS